MQANDVKPTRLAAAQTGVRIFLKKCAEAAEGRADPLRRRGGGRDAADRPTTRSCARRSATPAPFRGFGGTAIGDALAAAVQLGLKSAGLERPAARSPPYRRVAPTRSPASSLVSILFLSDGHQTRGAPAAARRARRRRRRRASPSTRSRSERRTGRSRTSPALRRRRLQLPGRRRRAGAAFRPAARPDDAARDRAPDRREFFRRDARRARSQAAYSKLGSSLGRVPAARGDRRVPARRGDAARARGRALGALGAAASLVTTDVLPQHVRLDGATSLGENRGGDRCSPT